MCIRVILKRGIAFEKMAHVRGKYFLFVYAKWSILVPDGVFFGGVGGQFVLKSGLRICHF